MLGDLLRQERERQNLTIKDIEEGTSIRGLYLSSIEEGKYDVIPGEVFLKGFIKAYAGFLNLDGAEMLKLYYEEKNQQSVSQDPVISGSASEKVLVAEPKEFKGIKELREEKKNTESRFPVKLVVGALLCLGLGGVGYMFFSGDDVAEKSKVKTAAVVTKEEKKSGSVPIKPAAKPEAKPAVAAPVSQRVEITATLSASCWTQVEADGKVLFEGTLKSGDKLDWKAERELKITAGNAGGMEIVLNGKNIGKLGNVGEVITKSFVKDAATLPKT